MSLKMEHIERSDNLRIIHYKDRKQALAFMELMQGIEAGTAMVRCPGEGYATGASIEVGALALYKAMAGDVYDAVVVALRAPGLVDLDVVMPGVSDPMRLTKVRFVEQGRR